MSFLVLTQDISRSAHPALTHEAQQIQMLPRTTSGVFSVSPAPPLSLFPLLITLLTLTSHSHACSWQAALATNLLQTASSSAAAWQQTHSGQPITHRTLGVCGHPLMSHTGGPCLSSNLVGLGPQLVLMVKQRECFYDLLHTL